MQTMEELKWQPDPELLGCIVKVLQDAAVGDTQIQCRVTQSITRFDERGDAACYYAYVFAFLKSQEDDLRQRAGLLLKSRIPHLVAYDKSLPVLPSSGKGECISSYTLENQFRYVLHYIKSCVMNAMCDEVMVIRHTAATILTTMAGSGKKDLALELVTFLIQFLDHADPDIRSTAFRPIAMIIEDEMRSTHMPLDYSFIEFFEDKLFPKLFNASHYDSTFRYYSLLCLNHFNVRGCFSPNEPLYKHLKAYWEFLGQLALDASLDVRQETLRGMGLMVVHWYNVVADSLDSLLPFLMECIEPSQPYNIKFEASDVLRHIVFICDRDEPLKNIMPIALPRLFENTRYSEWDYAQMDQQQFDDDAQGYSDDRKDGVPFSSSHRLSVLNDEEDVNNDNDDLEEKDLSLLTSTWGANWTLRKASAVLIDRFAFRFEDLILPFVLPRIEQSLQNDNVWELQETAILVLGAIARGCATGLKPFLPKILDILVRVCDDTRPILRSISVWAISRFSVWICSRPEALDTVVALMLRRILDPNKCVQEAACSAFAYLEETAEDLLLPYLSSILETFHNAFSVLQGRNVIVLLDAIIVLVEVLDVWYDLPLVYKNIVEPLLQRWIQVSHECPSFTALCESVGRLIFEADKDIEPYKVPIWHRCGVLLQLGLDELNSLNPVSKRGESCSLVSPDTVSIEYRSNAYTAHTATECGIHILYMLCNIFQEYIKNLIQDPNFLNVVQRCYTYTCNDDRIQGNVKHDCLGVLGYCFNYAPQNMVSSVSVLVPLVSQDIVSHHIGISCNAVWMLGKMLEFAPPLQNPSDALALRNHTPMIMEKLVSVFYTKDDESRSALYDRVIMTLPFVARLSSPKTIWMLSQVFDVYCLHVSSIKLRHFRAEAVEGMLSIVNLQTSLPLKCLPQFLQLIFSLFIEPSVGEKAFYTEHPIWKTSAFRDAIVSVLTQVKNLDPVQFSNAVGSLDPSSQWVYDNLFLRN